MFNERDDAIGITTAKRLVDNFPHKPGNLEHKTEIIVSHVVSSSFADRETNQMVSFESVAEESGPVNISLSAVVYADVIPEFTEALVASTIEGHPFYRAISTSWEVLFWEYYIAVGEGDLIRDVQIITDDDEVTELSKYLKSRGGNGYDGQGRRIRRVITGDILPVGFGFTSSPAAAVSGVVVQMPWVDTSIANMDNFKKIISHSQNPNVNNNKDIINDMDPEKILTELKSLLEKGNFSEKTVANLTQNFAEVIKEKDKEYKEAIEKASNEKAEAEKRLKDLEDSVASMKTELKTVKTEKEALEQEQEKQALAAKLQERISTIDEKFELGDEERGVILNELKAVASDEDFTAYMSKLDVLLASKTKKAIEQHEREEQERLTKIAAASLETAGGEISDDLLKSILEKAKASIEETTPNGKTGDGEDDLKTKFNKAFNKDTIQIKY
jgi:predicted nuclease with TOPRIM domain